MTGFAIAITVACLAAAALWVVNQRFKSPWARAAHRLGLELRGSTLVGHIDGIAVTVHAPHTAGPAGANAVASLHCHLPMPLDLGLSMRVLSGIPAGHEHGPLEVMSGDEDFDANMSVHSDEAARVEPLLANLALRDALVDLALAEKGVSVTDDGVHVKLRGPGEASERLPDAVELALAVVHQLEQVRHDIPVADDLSEHRRAWAAVAGALDLDLSTAPLAVSGLLDGVPVTARTERLEEGVHGLVLSATFEAPLGLGLSVVTRRGRRKRERTNPESRRDQRRSFGKLFDREQRRVRVRFRRAFDVRAQEVWAADQFLGQPIQEALLGLRSEDGLVTLVDDELRVTDPTVPRQRPTLELALRKVAAAGRLIGQGALGGGGVELGPYR